MQALLDAIRHMPRTEDATRLFHGRGGMHPGCEHLSLDAFPPVLVLTSFAELGDASIAAVGQALEARWAEIAPGEPLNWVLQIRLVGGQGSTRIMSGSVPEPHVVTEAGTRYGVHVARGQNHGLFLDMAAGRQWVREHVAAHTTRERGFKVLNLFAYTCAFSVVAMQAEAPEFEFMERVANPPVFADRDPERSLKVLVYRRQRTADTVLS